MDNKKEMERAELHRAIWQIANDLRGSVDGWDFKQYVLGTLFYRYISEKLTNYLNREAHEAGDTAFDYAALSDKEAETERENLVAHGHGQGAGEQSVRQKHFENDTTARAQKHLEITEFRRFYGLLGQVGVTEIWRGRRKIVGSIEYPETIAFSIVSGYSIVKR